MRQLKNLSKHDKVSLLLSLREKKIRKARESLFEFCHIRHPEFYSSDKKHLVILCETLQALYEGRIIRFNKSDPWKIVPKKPKGLHFTCRSLMLQMPPRFGKSRTLVNFSAWILGKKNENRIMQFSYNDDLAMDFSKYTRDAISEKKYDPLSIIYSDIFPDTSIKKGDGAKEQWALEGQFFNYTGAGREGGATGKGGNISIYDDLLKNASEAVNDRVLEKTWIWFDATAASRLEEGGIQILCGTPWSKGDPQARILDSEEANDWYLLSMPVAENLVYRKNEFDRDELVSADMLCPDLMSFETFKKRLNRAMINPVTKAIFFANYLMKRMSIEGLLYRQFKTYDRIPKHTTGHITYIDTADTGSDYLAAIGGPVKDGICYVNGIYYTQEPMEVTEEGAADFLIKIGARMVFIESNAGGRGFARKVQDILKTRGHNEISIEWFHQGENKQSRIFTNAASVQENILMPEGWNNLYPEAFLSLTTYSKEGKNEHDDIEDAVTGLFEKMNGSFNYSALNQW